MGDRAQPPGISQRPRPGATRCPYCHDVCEADPDACACAACLSRHHRACWDEAGRCGSCQAGARLELAAPPAEADPRGYAAAVEAWLRLAAVYNAVLALATVALLGGRLLSPAVLVQVLVGAFLANLCFLAGPGAEIALRRLNLPLVAAASRWVLFPLGLLVALALVLVSCASLPTPD